MVSNTWNPPPKNVPDSIPLTPFQPLLLAIVPSAASTGEEPPACNHLQHLCLELSQHKKTNLIIYWKELNEKTAFPIPIYQAYSHHSDRFSIRYHTWEWVTGSEYHGFGRSRNQITSNKLRLGLSSHGASVRQSVTWVTAIVSSQVFGWWWKKMNVTV